MKFILTTLAAAAIASSAYAAPVVEAAWSRPAAQGTVAGGFFTLVNPKGPTDTLTGVSTPIARKVQMHRSTMSGGVMSMSPVASVAVPAGDKVTFAPGGYHLMLMGVSRTLKMGDTFPATFTFASGAKITATFVVALAPPAAK